MKKNYSPHNYPLERKKCASISTDASDGYSGVEKSVNGANNSDKNMPKGASNRENNMCTSANKLLILLRTGANNYIYVD